MYCFFLYSAVIHFLRRKCLQFFSLWCIHKQQNYLVCLQCTKTVDLIKVVLHFKTLNVYNYTTFQVKIKTDTIHLCMFIMYFEKKKKKGEILPVIQVIDNTNLSQNPICSTTTGHCMENRPFQLSKLYLQWDRSYESNQTEGLKINDCIDVLRTSAGNTQAWMSSHLWWDWSLNALV